MHVRALRKGIRGEGGRVAERVTTMKEAGVVEEGLGQEGHI